MALHERLEEFEEEQGEAHAQVMARFSPEDGIIWLGLLRINKYTWNLRAGGSALIVLVIEGILAFAPCGRVEVGREEDEPALHLFPNFSSFLGNCGTAALLLGAVIFLQFVSLIVVACGTPVVRNSGVPERDELTQLRRIMRINTTIYILCMLCALAAIVKPMCLNEHLKVKPYALAESWCDNNHHMCCVVCLFFVPLAGLLVNCLFATERSDVKDGEATADLRIVYSASLWEGMAAFAFVGFMITNGLGMEQWTAKLEALIPLSFELLAICLLLLSGVSRLLVERALLEDPLAEDRPLVDKTKTKSAFIAALFVVVMWVATVCFRAVWIKWGGAGGDSQILTAE